MEGKVDGRIPNSFSLKDEVGDGLPVDGTCDATGNADSEGNGDEVWIFFEFSST